MNEFKIDLQLFAGEDDFSDVVLDETATPTAEIDDISTEPIEEPTIPKVGSTEPVQTEPKFKIKYNHQEEEVDLPTITELAQKGKNYDKLQEKLQGLEKSPALAYVEKLAKANNMTVDQIVQHWQQADEQAEIQALAEKDNVPYEIAERLYRVEQKANQTETRLNTEQQTKAEQEKQQKEFNEFFENYPDVKADSVPKEVWERREKTGKSLSDAMAWHENQQLKSEIKLLKQNAENAKKAPVGSVTAHGSKEIEDSDFAGFDD
jgi:hypothetical protein